MDKKLLIEISANTKAAQEEIRRLKQEIETFSQNVKKSNSSLDQQTQHLQKLSSAIKKVVTAYAAFEVGKSIVDAAAKFEQSMVNVKTIVGATNEQFEALRAKAKELGETTQFSASEAAEGMKYLAMAGYKTEEIIAAMPSVLNLATIGQTDLAQASDIASNILSGFGLKATETTRVVDVMAKTITNSNTDIKELGYAFSYAAPQAKALGVSVEEASAAIGVLSNAGIKGTMAGTGLAQILTRLSAPTGAAKDAIEQLGIKIFDAKGKFVGLQKALLQFNSALSRMSQEDRMRVIKDIFGEEAAKSALTLIDNVKTGYQNLYKEIEKASGASAKMAKQMQDTFEGKIKELKSALEALAIAIGEDLLPALSEFVKGLTEVVRGSKEFYEENKALIKTVTELIAVFYGLSKIKTLLIAVLGAGAAKEIRSFKTALMALIPIVSNLKNALLALSAVNPVLAGLAVAIGGVTYALNTWEEEIEKTDRLTERFLNLSQSAKKLYLELEERYNRQTHTLKLLNGEKEKYLKRADAIINQKRALIKVLQEDSQKNRAQIEVVKNSIRVLEKWKNIIKKSKEEQRKLGQESEKTAKKIDYLTQEEIKAIEKRKKAQERELEHFRRLYTRRVDMHKSALERIKAKEQKILNDILEENRRFQQKLASIERSRLNALEDINNKIHNLNLAGASEYERYIDKQKQAEQRLARAKEAIRRGDLEQAKRYINQYKSLIDSIANTEIKKDKKVIVSKKQAAQVAIGLLNRLKGVTNSYYELEKQKATQAHNMRLQQLKTQLQAVRAQIKLELERLKLEQQIVQMLTGKKVSIDTSSALQAIKQLDSQIKSLDQQIKHPKKIDADTNPAKAKVSQLDAEVSRKKGTMKVDANTAPAGHAVMVITDKIAKTKKAIIVGAKTDEAKKELNKVVAEIKKKHPKFKVIIQADKKKVDNAITIIDKKTNKKRIIKLGGDNKEAIKSIKNVDSTAKKIKPVVKVKSDVSKALANLKKIPRRIVTEHIIVEKVVKQRATGGYIEPIQRASGGEIDVREFKRASGRIAGYDPTDSDSVPALLTAGEFVIKRDAVKYYGDDFLYRLNNMLLPKFASGGYVRHRRSEKLYEFLGAIQKNDEPSYNNSYSYSYEYNKLNDDGFYEKEEIEDKEPKIYTIDPIDPNLDLSTLEDVASQIKELVAQLKGVKNPITAQASGELQDIDAMKAVGQKLLKDVENFNENTDKEIISEAIYRSLLSKKENLEKKLELFSQKIEEESQKANNVIEEIERYIEKVEDIKSQIEDKLYDLGVENQPTEFSESYDLNRLQRYLNNLNMLKIPKIEEITAVNSNIPKDEDIDRAFSDAYNAAKAAAQKYYYSIIPGGYVTTGAMDRYTIDASAVARSISNGRLDPASSLALGRLVARYSIPVNYRVFGREYKQLPEEAHSAIKRLFIKSSAKEIEKRYGIKIDSSFFEDAVIDESEAEEIVKLYIQKHLPAFKRGGRVAGYDPSDSDDVLARLTRGEFVIRREAVKHYGDEFLHKINSKVLPRFYTGGLVDIGELSVEKRSSSTSKSSRGSDIAKIIAPIERLLRIVRTSERVQEQQKYGVMQEHINNSMLVGRNLLMSPSQSQLLDASRGAVAVLKQYENFLVSIENRIKSLVQKIEQLNKEVESLKQKSYTQTGKDEKATKELIKSKTKEKESLKSELNNTITSYNTKREEIIVKLNQLGNQIPANLFALKVPKFAKGGKIQGYDPSDSDTILARLTAGEFVIRRQAVDHYGVGLLEQLNSIQLPKFATGGYVGRLKSDGYRESVDVNFNMPSGQSYTMNAKIDVAKALAQEFRRLG